jgi:bifunctional non-homologous end joining protein LigD
LRGRPVLQRKDALYRTLPANRRIRYASHIVGSSTEIWQLATAMDLEGIVAKRADSRYVAGRSNYWQKIKTTTAEEPDRERGRG